MNILLSVKPEFANKIFIGEKRYEFRKHTFKQHNVEKMYIYSTAPIKKVIGVVDLENIVMGTPKALWDKCYKTSGISKHDFFEYFKNTYIGYAFEMTNIKKFTPPIDPYLDPDFRPPQSFMYIK